jgi:CRP-like cAMP-binding protein
MTIACSAVDLRGLPLFSLLGDSDLAAVQPQTVLRNYGPGSEILKSGETADGIYLLLSGTVDVLLQDTRGHKVIVDTLRADETFNEPAIFKETASKLTFVAAKTSQVLFVPREALAQALDHNCKLSAFVAAALARRLEHSYEKLGVLGLDDVYTRVLDVILTRGNERDGAWHVDVGAGTIAEMVGASREMVSRVTKDLVKRNLIRREKRKIVVDDRGALQERAAQRRSSGPEKKRPSLQVRSVPTTALEIAAG